jgi:hypothetical protein
VRAPRGNAQYVDFYNSSTLAGLDHGVGHPLLLLYDAKAPHWTRVRICAETYGFARQKTRGGSMNLILISWMSFLVDF